MFLAIWLGAIWATIALHAPLMFPIVFGAFGVLLTFLALDQWLRVTRVTAGDGVGDRRERLACARRRADAPGREIADVTTRIGMQSGGTPYYDVIIVTTAGKRIGAGGGIREKREAEWLAGVVGGRSG